MFTAKREMNVAVRQPQLTISRHRHSGVKESDKFNLEANQFYYDVRRITSEIDNISEMYEDMFRSMWELAEIEDETFTQFWEDFSVSEVFSETLGDIINRIENLELRLIRSEISTGDANEFYPSDDNFPADDNWPGP